MAVSGGRDIVPLVNRLLASPRFVMKVVTQDWVSTPSYRLTVLPYIFRLSRQRY